MTRTAGWVRRAATIWRRSIQARVVISILLLSAVVVTLVGWVLLRQVTDGLVSSRTTAAVAEASRATLDAQHRLSAASGTDFDSSAQLTSIVDRGSVQGYDVVLTGPIAGTSQAVTAGSGTRNTPG
ncbi:MAG: MtrAB system histidine kinase MtrB, partial [Nocardioidaceae bacterium]